MYASLKQKFAELAAAKRPFTDHEEILDALYLEALKDSLRETAVAQALEPQVAPVLSFYSSDSTGAFCRVQGNRATPYGTVQRRGRVHEEFLMERGFIKNVVGQEMRMTPLIRDPRPLQQGKKAGNSFQAWCDFELNLRTVGGKGILLEHSCFDRALLGPVALLMRQRRRCYYDLNPDELDEHTLLRGKLGHLQSCVGDALHDMHNGLKWGLRVHGDPLLEVSVYITIESVRNGWWDLHKHLVSWLLVVVDFTEMPDEAYPTRELWQALGVEEKWVENLLEVGLYWSDGTLHVRPELRADPKCWEKLSGVWAYCMKWRKFSTGRWHGVGGSCRLLLRALTVGLEGLVAYTREDPLVGDYYLHGFDRFGQAERRYMVLAALCSWPAEKFISAVLQDDRLLRDVAKYKATLEQGLCWLEDMSDQVWKSLAQTAKVPEDWPNLKDQCLTAAHVSCGFVHHRVFDEMNKEPWSWVQHGPEEAARMLQEANPDDLESEWLGNLRESVSLGLSEVALVSVFELAREVPWSTKQCEQAHASTTLLVRKHPDATPARIAVRSGLHQARFLFGEDREAKKEAKLQDKYEAQLRRRGKRVTSQNILVREMVSEHTRVARGKPLPAGLVNQVVRDSHKEYESASGDRKRQLEAKAERATAAKRLMVKTDVKAAKEALDKHRRETAERLASDGLPNNLTSCTLSSLPFAACQPACGVFERARGLQLLGVGRWPLALGRWPLAAGRVHRTGG